MCCRQQPKKGSRRGWNCSLLRQALHGGKKQQGGKQKKGGGSKGGGKGFGA